MFNDKTTQMVIPDWERKNQSSNVLANELAQVGRPELVFKHFLSPQGVD